MNKTLFLDNNTINHRPECKLIVLEILDVM